MRHLLLLLGSFLVIYFPYSIFSKFQKLLQWVYTGYVTRKFQYWGASNKIDFLNAYLWRKYD